jgi:hypothetical protein
MLKINRYRRAGKQREESNWGLLFQKSKNGRRDLPPSISSVRSVGEQLPSLVCPEGLILSRAFQIEGRDRNRFKR